MDMMAAAHAVRMALMQVEGKEGSVVVKRRVHGLDEVLEEVHTDVNMELAVLGVEAAEEARHKCQEASGELEDLEEEDRRMKAEDTDESSPEVSIQAHSQELKIRMEDNEEDKREVPRGRVPAEDHNMVADHIETHLALALALVQAYIW